MVQKPHELFKRNGNDLLMEKKITLVEALSGFQFAFTHLDGKQYVVKSEKGDVLRPGDIRALHSLGMPVYKKSFEKGTLFIQFDVEFPKQNFLKSEKQTGTLSDLLGQVPTTVKVTGEMEPVTCTFVNMKQHQQQQQQRQAYEQDEDDDEGHGHGGPRGVPCTQQ